MLRLYDWDGWFSYASIVIWRGHHYECSQASMEQQVRNAAYHRGLRVKVESGDDFLLVTVFRSVPSDPSSYLVEEVSHSSSN